MPLRIKQAYILLDYEMLLSDELSVFCSTAIHL